MEDTQTPEVNPTPQPQASMPASPVPGPQKKSKKKLIIGGVIGALLIAGIAFGSTSNFFGAFQVYGDGQLEVTTAGISDDYTMLTAQICTNGFIAAVETENLMAAMTGGLTTDPLQIVGDGEATEDGDVELEEAGGTDDKNTPSGGDLPTTGGTDNAVNEDVESANTMPEADMALPSTETFDDPGTEMTLDSDVPDAGSQVESHVDPDYTDAETEAALNVPEPESQVETHVDPNLADTETEMAQDPNAEVEPEEENFAGAETTTALQYISGKVKFQIEKEKFYENVTVDNGGCTYVDMEVNKFDLEAGKTYTATVGVQDSNKASDSKDFTFTMPGGKDLYIDAAGENDINPEKFMANICGEGTEGNESIKLNWNANGIDDIKGVTAPADGNCKAYYSSDIETFNFDPAKGAYDVTVTVDYHEYVDETNENNNTDEFTYTPEEDFMLEGDVMEFDEEDDTTMVLDTEATDLSDELPDLTINKIYLDGSKLTVRMKNTGEGDVPSSDMSEGYTYIYIDNELEWTYSWSTLDNTGFSKAGGTAEIQPQTLSGAHLVQACVDALDAVEESDEKDNCKAVKFDTEGDDTNVTPDVTIDFNQEIENFVEDTNGDSKPDYNYQLNSQLVDLIGTDDEVLLEVGGVEVAVDEEDFESDETTTLEVGDMEIAVNEEDYASDEETTLEVGDIEIAVNEEDYASDEDEEIDFGPAGELESDYDFSDVDDDAWYSDYVYEVADLGIMTGNDDGTFDPSAELTRAAIAKIAVTAFGYELQTNYDAGFADVNEGDWFEDYVNTAAYYGIINGSADYFYPGDKVNRAEAAKVLIGAIINHLTDAEQYLGSSAVWSNPFSDVSTADWFYEPVMQAVYSDAIGGYADGTFRPANTILRAEVAKIVYTLVQIAGSPTI